MIKITYFAQFRESTNKQEENLQDFPSNAVDLYENISQQYSFNLDQKSVLLSVNDEFQDWNYILKPGDHVVFIPPMNGG